MHTTSSHYSEEALGRALHPANMTVFFMIDRPYFIFNYPSLQKKAGKH
jgi:hypothetical protein